MAVAEHHHVDPEVLIPLDFRVARASGRLGFVGEHNPTASQDLLGLQRV